MDTALLKKFAQRARRQLLKQVAAKLEYVLAAGSAARREAPQAVAELEAQLKANGKEQVIDKVAYTWFNRLCALRFMDLKGYTRVHVVSAADESLLQPEILADAKAGHINAEHVPEATRQKVQQLLAGNSPSHDPDQEAYRLLLVAECNHYHLAMPYLFQRIDDYTELLMPEDLLSANSVLAQTRVAMTLDACRDVEVIGWLYQFYISEKKDEVFAALKKSQKITPHNIPAATQLFTPHWIVRYLVENSLGRLWMLNHPDSALAERMDYYIPATEQDADYLHIERPEDIRICDPACGSGHMLTYAFDLLYAIYEEVGTTPSEIPTRILTHNLYGIERDERAGELAAFALTMKACTHQRRFFRQPVEPHICVLEPIRFDTDELNDYMAEAGGDLFTLDLRDTLEQFAEADNFGSLIQPKVANVDDALQALAEQDVHGNLFLAATHKKVLKALRMADYLGPHYHVVVANPPYMGSKGMNGRLKAWLNNDYADFKSDLFASFVVRCSALARPNATVGLVSPNVWMYIASHESLRTFVTDHRTLHSLVELPLTGFAAATVQLCAYTFSNADGHCASGTYIRLVAFKGKDRELSELTRRAIVDDNCVYRYRVAANKFVMIPGKPIAYWVSDEFRKAFVGSDALGDVGKARLGMATGNNNAYVRTWPEVSFDKIGLETSSRAAAVGSHKKWFPYNKGGNFRRWYGNNEFVVNWEDDGKLLRTTLHPSGDRVWAHNFNLDYIFKACLTFTATSSSYFGIRYSDVGFIFDNKGSSYFTDDNKLLPVLGLLASKTATAILEALNPTVEFQPGNISVIPFFAGLARPGVADRVGGIVHINKTDWDAAERSWNFARMALIECIAATEQAGPTSKRTIPRMSDAYKGFRAMARQAVRDTSTLEFDNNKIFIEAYGLQDELTPDVPLEEITLTCNPHYRYGGNKSEEELEALLLADTMREFCSYAVGCMFGRYSLDKPGLVLANQGETLKDYLKQIPEPSFMPDEDNVIPLLDAEWFPDDVTERFRTFLRVSFGTEHYDENLAFIERGLNINHKRNYSIRDFFVREFYGYHVKLYKKRPIYWLFASPKGTFQALIYLHRYRPDTVSVVLGYLRDFRTKLTARQSQVERRVVDPEASQVEKTRLNKELDTLKKQILELTDYERDVLHPLALQRIEIDLDDGVKANYPKFGAALKSIPGLAAKDE